MTFEVTGRSSQKLDLQIINPFSVKAFQVLLSQLVSLTRVESYDISEVRRAQPDCRDRFDSTCCWGFCPPLRTCYLCFPCTYCQVGQGLVLTSIASVSSCDNSQKCHTTSFQGRSLHGLHPWTISGCGDRPELLRLPSWDTCLH